MKDTWFLTFFVVHCWKEPCMHVLISKVGWDVGRTQREFNLDYMAFIMSKGFKNYICNAHSNTPCPLLDLHHLFGLFFVLNHLLPHATHTFHRSQDKEVTHAYERTWEIGGVDLLRIRWTLYSKRSFKKKKTSHHCQPLQTSNSTHSNMFFVQRGWFVRSDIEYWVTCFGFSWHVLCCWSSLLILC